MDIKNGLFVDAKTEDEVEDVLSVGGILVPSSDFDELGAETIRKMNCQPHAEIIVVPDEKYKAMTAAEKMSFLQQNVTKLPR